MLKLGPHTVEVEGLGTVKFEVTISKESKSNTIPEILIRAIAKTLKDKLLAFTK